MSTLLSEIVRAVNEEVVPALPKIKSEKQRIAMRNTLSALEKMIRHIRLELLKESKQIKADRKNKLINKNKKNNINSNIQEYTSNTQVEDAGPL